MNELTTEQMSRLPKYARERIMLLQTQMAERDATIREMAGAVDSPSWYTRDTRGAGMDPLPRISDGLILTSPYKAAVGVLRLSDVSVEVSAAHGVLTVHPGSPNRVRIRRTQA